MSEQKAKFREEIDRFAKEHYNATSDKLGSDKRRSDALTLCYLLSIRNKLLPGCVPDDFEELGAFICDNAYDKTADFIYCDDNNHVTIIQAKHRSRDSMESEPDFDSFRQCLVKLCPETRHPDIKINQKVLDLVADIDWEDTTFSLIFLSLARNSDTITQNAEREIENIPNSPLKDISDRVDLEYLSEERLNEKWRDVVGQNIGAATSVELLLTKSQQGQSYFYFESSEATRSYIVLLSASQIHQLYNRHREKLFNLNIRNYIGDTRTNKDIIKSAASESNKFFFYNNGLSAVATKIESQRRDEHDILVCHGFSIINGAQTFRSVSKAYSRRKNTEIKDLRVLVRISEFNYLKDKEAEFLDKITRYNNTQNSMKLSDFRSNDAVQQALVKYINEVPAYKGQKYLWVPLLTLILASFYKKAFFCPG